MSNSYQRFGCQCKTFLVTNVTLGVSVTLKIVLASFSTATFIADCYRSSIFGAVPICLTALTPLTNFLTVNDTTSGTWRTLKLLFARNLSALTVVAVFSLLAVRPRKARVWFPCAFASGTEFAGSCAICVTGTALILAQYDALMIRAKSTRPSAIIVSHATICTRFLHAHAVPALNAGAATSAIGISDTAVGLARAFISLANHAVAAAVSVS